MNEQEQAHFDGWAIVDVLGHQRYTGYVRTEAYGQAVMFRVDVPELPEREYQLKRAQYATLADDTERWAPAGSTVRRPPVPGFTKLIGAGSIYSISPCDEQAALVAIEEAQRPPLKLISLPPNVVALPPGTESDDSDADDLDDEEEDDGEDEDE